MNCAQEEPSSPSGGRKANRPESSKIGASARRPRRSRQGTWRIVMQPCGLDRSESRQDLCHHSCRFHAGKLLLQPLERIVELVMVEAHCVKNGRMKIANFYRVLYDLVAHSIGLAEAHSGFDSAS